MAGHFFYQPIPEPNRHVIAVLSVPIEGAEDHAICAGLFSHNQGILVSLSWVVGSVALLRDSVELRNHTRSLGALQIQQGRLALNSPRHVTNKRSPTMDACMHARMLYSPCLCSPCIFSSPQMVRFLVLWNHQ